MSEFRGPADNQPNTSSRRCNYCQELQRPVLTTHVKLYYRCPSCGQGWSEANPGKWIESLTGQTAITLDVLVALVREAAACLREVDQLVNRPVVDRSTKDPASPGSVTDADPAGRRAITARVRALLQQHSELDFRTELLFQEGEALGPEDHHRRDSHRHQIRQHHARLEAHLDQVRALLTDLRRRFS